VYIQLGQEVTAKFTCQLCFFCFVYPSGVKWWLAKSWQKKLIREHSSNEVSLAAAFVWTLTMVRVIWIPLRRAKWPPIVRVERAGSDAPLSPQKGRSNYDIIFLQDFSGSSHFTQKAWNWDGVGWRKLPLLEGVSHAEILLWELLRSTSLRFKIVQSYKMLFIIKGANPPT